MKYEVEKFNGQGRFLDREVVDAPNPTAARELAFFGVPHFYDRDDGEAYCHVTRYVEPLKPTDECPRCGSQVSTCGGPRNPHE